MWITLLKAKLHQATVTRVEPDYEGSCAIDGALLELSRICEYEQIQIYNLDNGERFTTYAISAEKHSGIISINGAAAHKAEPGQQIIICSYCHLDHLQATEHRPVLVYLDQHNRPRHTRNSTPAQAA